MMRMFRCVCLIPLLVCLTVSAAGAQPTSFSDEAAFQQAVLNPTTVSFNSFPVGFLPQSTLPMGAVTVVLTTNGAAPIFGPGPFGFTTNFLSVGVQDGNNNVVINLPAGTKGAGMKIVSVFPVTVTAASGSGGSQTVNFSSSQVSFLGFIDPTGINTITISSPFVPQLTPIVNVGDITYAADLASSVVTVPTVSGLGLLVLAASLLLAGWRSVVRRTS